MNDLENYATLIDRIFGAQTTTFDVKKSYTNNIIGALNNPTEFASFTNNFTERLHRLHKIYSTEPFLKDVVVRVNDIATVNNWDGAFAELAALDHLNNDLLGRKNYLYKPIQPNVTIEATRTFAAAFGKHEANLDGYIEDLDFYLDVKCLRDNVAHILDRIYKKLKFRIREDFTILAEHPLDISFEEFKHQRDAIFNDLIYQIKPGITKIVSSNILPYLRFNLKWGPGINTAERTYNPFAHAENFHKTPFNYVTKFVKDRPSIIVLVTFPWFNQVINDFAGFNQVFYRAMARRFFLQYKNDATKFKSYAPGFNGEHTLYEVSQNLSGLIFLEDNTILSENPEITNVKAYAYSNPNAVNKLSHSLADNYLRSIAGINFDDFEHDNY